MTDMESDAEIGFSTTVPIEIPFTDAILDFNDKEYNSNNNHTISLNLAGVFIKEPTSKHVVYKINVISKDGKKWSVYRRYEDFIVLYDQIQQLYPNLGLNFPLKHHFSENFDHGVIMKRQLVLEEFLSKLLSLKDVFHADIVQHFFRFYANLNVNKDLKLWKEYANKAYRLEHTTKELRKIVQWQGLQIEQLKQELEDVSEREKRSSSENSKVFNKVLIEKQHAENQLETMIAALNQKEVEISNLKEEYERRELYAAKTRENERIRLEQEMNTQTMVFNERQYELVEAFNDISEKLAEYGAIKIIDIGDQTINFKPIKDVYKKINDLRLVIQNYQSELDKLYSFNVSVHQKEIEDLLVKNAISNKQIETKVDEIKGLSFKLKESNDSHSNEIRNKDEQIESLEENLDAANQFINDLKQKYFLSLYLGLKLNDALYLKTEQLIEHNFNPEDLYLTVKEEVESIESWPKWLSTKLKLSENFNFSSKEPMSLETADQVHPEPVTVLEF